MEVCLDVDVDVCMDVGMDVCVCGSVPGCVCGHDYGCVYGCVYIAMSLFACHLEKLSGVHSCVYAHVLCMYIITDIEAAPSISEGALMCVCTCSCVVYVHNLRHRGYPKRQSRHGRAYACACIWTEDHLA